uniref:Uncharacterized protein n=1 Tax=Rhodnius prolixus TaxID=13249 RepID=T1HFC6_RHOPR
MPDSNHEDVIRAVLYGLIIVTIDCDSHFCIH